MSVREELARTLFEATEPDWQWGGPLIGDACREERAYRQADAVVSKWLPTLAKNEAVVDAVTRVVCAPALEPSAYLEFTREHLEALATILGGAA